ncbi:MAG: alcohol dehydrogenase catalytic domain-containing protein [Clostridiales bacterium]|nr:alcohol dehydrogenase catalytic domain-containing protein [Clostridiales bacterium]
MINYVYQLVSPQVFSIKYQDIDFTGEVIVRPRYMAVCHADQRYFLGQRDPKVLRKKLPMALIHECCGEVVSDKTGTFRPGQNVVLIPNTPTIPDDIVFENYAKGAYFLSSGHDGFMREFVNLRPDRVVACDGVPPRIAAITEFVSVAVHAVTRFEMISHKRRNTIGIWGDGSLSYTVSCVLAKLFPESRIVVIGRNERKLAQFSFAHRTLLTGEVPEDFEIDHAFECCGGEGSYYAIDDVIRYINPQGTLMLMGVSENKVAINTRDVLEKGMTLVGSSRSGRADFERAVSLMQESAFQNRLNSIIYEDRPVSAIEDISRVLETDLNTPFKTVFRWNM